MKTRYLLEAQNSLLNFLNFETNTLVSDLRSPDGAYFVGLLSSLPDDGKDGWQGAGELYNDGTSSPYLQGIKKPNITTAGYYPVEVSRLGFTAPGLTNVPSLGISGIVAEFQQTIQYNPATADWPQPVLGLVLYSVRASASINRITPLATFPLTTPIQVRQNDTLTIPDQSANRFRVIDLIKKTVLN